MNDLTALGGPAISTGTAVPPLTVTLSGEYTFPIFDKQAYLWLEDAYHSANNGPFSTHNPANIIVYDKDLVPDPATNMVNFRAGVRFTHLDLSLFLNNALNAHPQLSLEHTNPGDPRYAAVTFRPLTVGLTASVRF